MTGGEAMTLRSLKPARPAARVRGVGVALIQRAWIPLASSESFAFSAAPKCCSSSMITRPRSANFTSLEARAWVPTTTFNLPLFSPSFASLVSAAEAARDKLSTSIWNGAKRLRKVATCCLAKTVVGTAIATCFPDSTTAAAARKATSVLPNPTSPQMTLSIGRPDARSSRTSRTAFAWSTVVKYGKRATNLS
jgi:hypothetical protein